MIITVKTAYIYILTYIYMSEIRRGYKEMEIVVLRGFFFLVKLF